MITFEEQFPSLNGYGVSSFETDDNSDTVVECEEDWYPEFIISEMCLDKQKVREAIEKHKLRVDGKGYCNTEKLLKELGL